MHDQIKIKVVKIRNGIVSLGVSAPKQLPIIRLDYCLLAGDTPHEPSLKTVHNSASSDERESQDLC